MNNPIRKTYTLGGLSCAHCAEKIQQGLAGLDPEVRFTLNFSVGTLVIETSRPERIPQLVRRAEALITDIEPGVTLTDQDMRSNGAPDALPILEYRLAAAFLVFFPPLLMTLNPVLEMALYLTAYGVAGWDVIWKALQNMVKGRMLDENFLMTIATAGALAI